MLTRTRLQLPSLPPVVRSNGDLSGYRWGIERKRALLEQHRAECNPFREESLCWLSNDRMQSKAEGSLCIKVRL